MCSLSDVELIQNIKSTGDNNSFDEICSRHSGIFYSVAKNHVNMRNPTNMDSYDIGNDREFVIYDAILKYDPSRNMKFSTWLGEYTRFYCLNSFKKRISPKDSCPPDSEEVVEELEEMLDSNKEDLIYKAKEYLVQCSDQTQKIVNMRFFNNDAMKYREIALKMGCSKQWVSKVIKKYLSGLKNKLTKQGYLVK